MLKSSKKYPYTPVACALLAILLGLLSIPSLPLERLPSQTDGPVLIASVTRDDAEIYQFSTLVQRTLLPQFSAVSGVASVGADGLIEKQLQISIDQDKVEAANHVLLQSIDHKFSEVESKLLSDEQKLVDAMRKLEEDGERNQQLLDGMLAQLHEGQSQLPGTIGQLETERAEVQAELDQLRASIAQQEAELISLSSPNALTGDQMEALNSFTQNLALMKSQKQSLETEPADMAAARIAQVDAAIETIERNPLYISLSTRQQQIENRTSAQAKLEEDRVGILPMETEISRLDTMLQKLRSGILPSGIVQGIDEDIPLEDSLNQLQNQSTRLTEQLATVAQQITSGQEVLNTERQSFEQQRERLFQEAGLGGTLTLKSAWALLASYCTGLPEGRLSEDGSSYGATVGVPYIDPDAMGETLLVPAGANGQGEIRLKDVATLTPTDSGASQEGERGKVTLTFRALPDQSTGQVIERIGQAIGEALSSNAGLHIDVVSDANGELQGMFDAAHKKLLLGATLLALMLLILLWDLAAALIAAAVVPVSLGMALFAMRFMDIALTEATLAALIIGMGLSLICPILSLEMARKEHSGGLMVAAVAAMLGVLVPLGLVWADGLMAVEKQAGLVVAVLMTTSLVASITLVPALAGGLTRPGKWMKHRVMAGLQHVYGQVLKGLLCVKVFGIVAVLAAAWYAYQLGGQMGMLVDAAQWARIGGLVVLVVYLALLAGLQSIWKPIAVLVAEIPFVAVGALLGLTLTGTGWSHTVLIGLGALPGLAAIGGMWFASRVEHAKDRESVVQAGRESFRPVIMTTLAAVLGLAGWVIPEIGKDAAMPAIIVLAGGMLGALIGNLLVLPTVYGLLSRKIIIPDAEPQMIEVTTEPESEPSGEAQ